MSDYVLVETEEPSQLAMNAWYESRKGHLDRPSVHVNSPSSLPECYVRTRSKGCHQPDTLPKGPLYATLRIGGVEFYDDIESLRLMVAAAAEAVEMAVYAVSELEVDDH